MSTQLSVGIGFYLRCSLLRLRVFSILSGNVISVEVRQIYTATCHLVYASILVQPEFINAVSLFELLEISVRNSLFPIFIRQFSDLVFTLERFKPTFHSHSRLRMISPSAENSHPYWKRLQCFARRWKGLSMSQWHRQIVVG